MYQEPRKRFRANLPLANVRMPVGMYGGDRGNAAGYSNGPNFFDWLFNSPREKHTQDYVAGAFG